MTRRQRNPHATLTDGPKPGVLFPFLGIDFNSLRKKAQAGFLLTVLLFVTACSMSPRVAGSGSEIDAILPSNASWTLFRLGGLRYARVPATPQAWADTGVSAGVSSNGLPSGVQWLGIPSPEGVFRPVQALPAARGYFYLVDGASSRLVLYDSAAGLISTFPLPDRFIPFSAARTAVFRGADGTFLFADYAAGEAFLYTDRESSESVGGTRAWMLRARTKMPVGWRDCVQQPGSEEISCRSGAGVLRFDGSLNRIPAGGSAADRSALQSNPLMSPGYPLSRLRWNVEGRTWVLEGLTPAGDTALFEFWPNNRTLSRTLKNLP